jgi:hypothetical protein
VLPRSPKTTVILADISLAIDDVRFTPKSGHRWV